METVHRSRSRKRKQKEKAKECQKTLRLELEEERKNLRQNQLSQMECQKKLKIAYERERMKSSTLQRQLCDTEVQLHRLKRFKSSIATPGQFARHVILNDASLDAITVPPSSITSCEDKLIIGKGRFGTCTKVLVHGIIACAKCLQDPPCLAKSLLNHEGTMLSKVRHPNIAFLLGIQSSKEPFQLITAFYSVSGVSVTVYDALFPVESKACAVELLRPLLTVQIWLGLMKELAEALEFIHNKSIIHRDIKSDNVVFNKVQGTIQCVLVDFGKSNYLGKIGVYKLTDVEKAKYREDHKHIAPDLVDGVSTVNCASDIYSYGRLLKNIIQYFPLPSVSTSVQRSIKRCLKYNYLERPTATEIVQVLSSSSQDHKNYLKEQQ